MLKVALVSRFPVDPDRPRGGVEAVTVVLARALSELDDIDLHVVTPTPGIDAVRTEPYGRATVHRLPPPKWPQLVEMMVGGPFLRQMARVLRDLRPDVIHTHEPISRALPDLGIPLVSTVHGFESQNIIADAKRGGRLRADLWDRLERRDWRRQKHIISIAEYVAQQLRPHTQAAIHPIFNPIDPRFFQARRNEIPGRVLTVGWVSERKNTLGSIESFARVAPHAPHARLIIAGSEKEPSYRRKLDDAIRRHGIEQQVEFIGHVGRDKLIPELEKASVFLLPSLQENAPMAIEEALAVGVPVVASNRCGMPYMIEDGRTGYLIEPHDYDQIADRLRRLIADDALRASMSSAARVWAEKNYHPHAVALQTREVYFIATGRQPPRNP
jgi:glycosyltransferase involved in cell wall biosynthesis